MNESHPVRTPVIAGFLFTALVVAGASAAYIKWAPDGAQLMRDHNQTGLKTSGHPIKKPAL